MLHACLCTICFVFCYTSWHIYAFSGTNLLTRCNSVSSLFSAVFVFQKSYTGNILGIRRNEARSSYFSRHETKSEGEPEGGQGHYTTTLDYRLMLVGKSLYPQRIVGRHSLWRIVGLQFLCVLSDFRSEMCQTLVSIGWSVVSAFPSDHRSVKNPDQLWVIKRADPREAKILAPTGAKIWFPPHQNSFSAAAY
jgi:hypothetical protein